VQELGDVVRYSVADRIALIEINRPDKRNAINRAVIDALTAAMAGLDDDAGADVAVLCGAGAAFSSGADVLESQMASRAELEASRDPMGLGHPFAELLHRCRNWKPVIAGVHGYALGMALGLVLDCDLSVAERDTFLQVTETPRGLGGYRHWALMKARGAGMFADEVCLTGRRFGAEEAYALGLITRLAEPGAARTMSLELAREIAQNPPLGVRETVRVRRWHTSRMTREVAFQTQSARLHLTEDFAEAVRAFAEKRPPGPFNAR
jgi:enoyl-CoA hydratase/carnithine racemase